MVCGRHCRSFIPEYMHMYRRSVSLLSPVSSTSLLAGVKAGRVHLCRVEDNTVWSYMTSDVPSRWDGNPLTAIHSFTFFYLHRISQLTFERTRSSKFEVKQKRRSENIPVVIARPWFEVSSPLFGNPTECYRALASSTFCKPTPAHRTSLSTQHIRPSGVFDRWSDGLELAVWRT